MADPNSEPTPVHGEVAIDVSMFGESSGLADLTLIVEDVRIPVIKAILAFTSPVFRAMIQGERTEKDQKEIELPGKTLDTFVPFLRCIYPEFMDRVTATNAASLLPLAWEYQIVKLTEQCEDFLIAWIGDKVNLDMSCDTLCKYLQLAEQCDRRRLKEVCCTRISTFSLDARMQYILLYKISTTSTIQIANLACKRHELYTSDVRSLLSLESINKYIGQLSNMHVHASFINEFFQALRVSYHICGRGSDDYKRLLERLRTECLRYPANAPKYSDFEQLPHDLKYDLQQIIPSFQKRF